MLNREAAVERTQRLTGVDSVEMVRKDRLDHFLDLDLVSSRARPALLDKVPIEVPTDAVHARLLFEDPMANNSDIQGQFFLVFSFLFMSLFLYRWFGRYDELSQLGELPADSLLLAGHFPSIGPSSE